MTVFTENGSEIALIIALAYIIQVQAGAWYVKFTDQIFGEAPPETAGRLMQTGVFALHQNDLIQKALELLQEEHIHSLAVLDNQEKVSGILTAETIFDYLANPKHTAQSEIRSLSLKPALKFKQQTPLKKAIRTMKTKHVYKVLITDSTGKVEGILTDTDILKHFSKN